MNWNSVALGTKERKYSQYVRQGVVELQIQQIILSYLSGNTSRAEVNHMTGHRPAA